MTKVFGGTDRFELIRRLGEGGFGTVYEAFDRQRRSRVALKLLKDGEGTALYRFKREFRALADVSHPNLVALDELLTDGWHWFFTMELVRGVPVVDYTRAAAGFDRLRAAFSQLADALQTIHRAGIVHCDIKPSNVLVAPDGRVVVLDFGLVSERPAAIGPEDVLRSSFDALRVAGTPAYMAPEQATAERLTPSADWYSVGVMLYEALTGQLPFSGSYLEVIGAKREQRPREPGELNAEAPRDLAALAMRLLDPDPARRPSGETVLRCMGAGAAASRLDAGGATPAQDLLVGRDPHLRRLGDAFEAALRGETVVAFVVGASGMGKTALVRRFLQELRGREPDVLVLTSRCYERETMPYKAVDPLVDAIAHHLQRLRDLEVARLLPRDIGFLARLFPVLLGVEEIRRAPPHMVNAIDALTIRQRAATALRDLLSRLTDRAPLLLAIDDAQWGDLDSAAILQEILRPPDAPPLLFIAACRSEDAAEARLLRALNNSIRGAPSPRVVDIEVGPLSDDDARQLALRLTAGGGADRSAAIARESAGNPFFVHELAQHSLTVGGATTLDAVVRERVAALPEAASRLLHAVALSAQSIPAEVALTAAGLDGSTSNVVHLLRTSRLIRGRPDEPNVETYHDRIRESLVGRLADDEAAAWHLRLATAWERSGMARPETLVVHFESAGEMAKTSQYAAAAAEKAQAALAFDRAAEFYALLVRLERDGERRREWLIRLGQALANAGRGHDASAAFLTALETASGEQAIELERCAATELIRAGYLDEAGEVLERLFPKVGVRFPGGDRRALLWLVGYRLLLAARGMRFRERAAAEIAPYALRRIDVLTSISPPLCLSSVIQGNALNAQAMWHALRAGEPRRVVISLTALAVQTAVVGARTERKAQRLVQQSQRLAEGLGDAWATGRTVLAEGMVLKLNGHWKQGADRLAQANDIFTGCTGVRWEMETAQMLIHDSLYWMGEWGRLARELPARRQEAEQRGDLYSATHVSARLSPLMHLAADRVDAARAEAERGLAHWTKRHFHLQHRFGVCTDVDIHLYSGRPEEASRHLAAAWPALRVMLLIIQHHRIEMVCYRARVALALAAAGDPLALRRAEKDARRLDRERSAWARALARLVHAAAARIRGDVATAATELEEAEAALRGCDMNMFAAAARWRRGELAGGAAGAALIESSREWMAAQQVANPARLVGLLAPGRW